MRNEKNTPDNESAENGSTEETTLEGRVSEEAVESISVQPETIRETQEVNIRRAPKYPVFIILGMVIGTTIALILTYSFPEVQGETTWSQVFGYLFLPSAAIGAALGVIVALILDRRSRNVKRIRQVTAEHTEVRGETEE